MPAIVPVLPDEQYSLPEAVGQLFDATILSNAAHRILADDWCRLSQAIPFVLELFFGLSEKL